MPRYQERRSLHRNFLKYFLTVENTSKVSSLNEPRNSLDMYNLKKKRNYIYFMCQTTLSRALLNSDMIYQ